MEEVLLEKQASTTTRLNMENYFKTHDVKYVAEDAVFINMGTGERHEGREAIGQMLHFIYHVAFDARAEMFNSIITEDKAVVEGNFIGTHTGEIAGLKPTYANVNVPLCVTYNLEKGLIKEARIYMASEVMMKQISEQVKPAHAQTTAEKLKGHTPLADVVAGVPLEELKYRAERVIHVKETLDAPGTPWSPGRALYQSGEK